MIYKNYLKSQWWKDTKSYLKYVIPKKCYVCSINKYLNIHHKSYGSLRYEDGNDLVYLCRQHHKKLHFRKGKKIIPDCPKNIELLESRLENMKEDWKKENKGIFVPKKNKRMSINQMNKQGISFPVSQWK